MLLSSLLYIYKNYDLEDNIYIENLNNLADLLILFEEISATGIYHYTRGVNMRNRRLQNKSNEIFLHLYYGL